MQYNSDISINIVDNEFYTRNDYLNKNLSQRLINFSILIKIRLYQNIDAT